MKYPSSLTKLIESYQKLPGIGIKTAERLAFYTVTSLSKDDVNEFSSDLVNAINSIRYCKVCGMMTDHEICEICETDNRDRTLIVVETPKDVIAMEKTGQINGRYHVLNGVIIPSNGIGPDDLNIKTIKPRIENEKIEEIILATSATIEGEMTAMYLSSILQEMGVKISRIAYGLPAGGDIEYADEITLIKALEGRRKI